MQLARTEIGDTTGIRGVVRDGGERGAREDVWWVWWVLTVLPVSILELVD